MNKLSTERRAQVVSCLVEGMSIRGTVRVTGVAKNTIVKLLADLGQTCADYQDVTLTNLSTKRVECDEIWSFCHSKQKNVAPEHEGEFGYGDVWTRVAIDADTKLLPTWLVGERTTIDAYTFLSDLKSRLRGRVQMTTDGHKPYLTVVEPLFGSDGIDFAMLHKLYGNEGGDEGQRRYSPAVCTDIDKRVICGEPNEALVSTSYVERQNLTMRMGMRRFTRLTNAFSKKVENLAHAVSIHFMHYNFCRVHQSLTITRPDGKRIKQTPAMAAGVATHAWSVYELVALLDAPKSN
jgi:IS1 family transposase